jgi:excinuclease ABC subunit B
VVEVVPSYEHSNGVRIEFFGDEIDRISEFDVLTGKINNDKKSISIYPASHFVTSDEKLKAAIVRIKEEAKDRLKYFKDNNKLLEHQRLMERTNYDIEMLVKQVFAEVLKTILGT